MSEPFTGLSVFVAKSFLLGASLIILLYGLSRQRDKPSLLATCISICALLLLVAGTYHVYIEQQTMRFLNQLSIKNVRHIQVQRLGVNDITQLAWLILPLKKSERFFQYPAKWGRSVSLHIRPNQGKTRHFRLAYYPPTKSAIIIIGPGSYAISHELPVILREMGVFLPGQR